MIGLKMENFVEVCGHCGGSGIDPRKVGPLMLLNGNKCDSCQGMGRKLNQDGRAIFELMDGIAKKEIYAGD